MCALAHPSQAIQRAADVIVQAKGTSRRRNIFGVLPSKDMNIVIRREAYDHVEKQARLMSRKRADNEDDRVTSPCSLKSNQTGKGRAREYPLSKPRVRRPECLSLFPYRVFHVPVIHIGVACLEVGSLSSGGGGWWMPCRAAER